MLWIWLIGRIVCSGEPAADPPKNNKQKTTAKSPSDFGFGVHHILATEESRPLLLRTSKTRHDHEQLGKTFLAAASYTEISLKLACCRQVKFVPAAHSSHLFSPHA
jgi:hypothetical protein